ncbi:MAG: patatin-like phospholipase family protein, partial [Fervidobacterium sp.]
ITFDSEKIESVVISEGYVVDAVLASCTVPGVFEPTHIAGVKMLDGGVLSPIPTHELRLQGADKVVASTFQDPPKKYSTHMELMIYVDSVKGDIIMEDELVLADFVFSYSVDVSWTEFSKYDKVYQNALKYAYDRRDEFENFLRR